MPATTVTRNATSTESVKPRASVEDYLRDGGFPEPLHLSDGDGLRRQYFHDIVERDIRERRTEPPRRDPPLANHHDQGGKTHHPEPNAQPRGQAQRIVRPTHEHRADDVHREDKSDR